MSFSDAVQCFAELRDCEERGGRIAPAGYSLLFEHGAPTGRVIVFFHGLTNSPRQFAELGKRFYEAGDTVYIPRLPHHGNRDRLTHELAGLTADELKVWTLEAVVLAAQLGRRVHVLGLSAGAVLALWAAQRIVLASATAIVPFIAVKNLPGSLHGALYQAASRVPGHYHWWDPFRKAANPHSPPHAYPGFPLGALAALLAVRHEVLAEACVRAPAAHVLGLLINRRDPVVSNRAALALFDRFRNKGATIVERRLRTDGLHHDIIDPWHPHLPHDAIYAAVMEMVPPG